MTALLKALRGCYAGSRREPMMSAGAALRCIRDPDQSAAQAAPRKPRLRSRQVCNLPPLSTLLSLAATC